MRVRSTARLHRRDLLWIPDVGNVKDIHAIKVALEEVAALERKIRVRESKLRQHQMHWLRNLRNTRHVELSQHLPHLWIIGISGPELKCAGLLEKREVLHAHRCF